MNKKLNLAPLAEFLTTGVPPRELALELDEILFDYVQMIFYLHRRRGEQEDFVHERAAEMLFYLRELRNVFWQCTEE